MSKWLEVTEDSVDCQRMPVESVRLAMCDWLRKHSIDPDDVMVPGWIIRDPVNRRVEYLGFHLDRCETPGELPIEKGRKHLTPDGREICREMKQVQLESPPLPWPQEVWIHIPPSQETP